MVLLDLGSPKEMSEIYLRDAMVLDNWLALLLEVQILHTHSSLDPWVKTQIESHWSYLLTFWNVQVGLLKVYS